MAVVKRIGPGSAFKVGVVLYGILGLIIGFLVSLFALVSSSFVSKAYGASIGAIFGIGAILIFPIFYGILGGVMAAIGAFLYNLAARLIGGLEVDIS